MAVKTYVFCRDADAGYWLTLLQFSLYKEGALSFLSVLFLSNFGPGFHEGRIISFLLLL